MGAERKHGFLKNLIYSETKETINDLKNCFEKDRESGVTSSDNIAKLIDQYLESVEESETESQTTPKLKNCLNEKEILNLIQILLESKLDFSHRLDGSRSVLGQWQKSRAFKNEEFSVQFRERGNNNLKNGQWNQALHFYNEAVLFGRCYLTLLYSVKD